MPISCRGQAEWLLQDNGWPDGAWVPPDCSMSEPVRKGQQRRLPEAHRVLKTPWMWEKTLSESSLFSNHAHFQPPSQQYICYFHGHPSRKSPWFIHTKGVTSVDAVYKLNIQQSDILDSFVIIQHGLLLNDNIHCICLLVIERLPPGWQCQASALCCPEIYWSIDCLTLPTSKLSLEPRDIGGIAPLSFFIPAGNSYN